jgi:hypothetical protein
MNIKILYLVAMGAEFSDLTLDTSRATSRRNIRWSANEGRALFCCTWHASMASIAKGEETLHFAQNFPR